MKFVLLMLLLITYVKAIGQSSYKLQIQSTEKIPVKNLQTSFKDSFAVKSYLSEIQLRSIEKGFLLFSIDTLKCSQWNATASIYCGPKFNQLFLTIAIEQRKYLSNSEGAVERLINNIAFTPKNVAKLLQTIEMNLLNKGYPFANVRLDSTRIINQNLHAHLKIEENIKVTWGEIVVKGNDRINSKLLGPYISIKPGELYQEEQIKLLSKQLNQIPFLTETKPFELLFHENKVDVYLYLTSKPVSMITGVLGLQPTTKNNIAGYALTGDIRMKLVNGLKKGENFDLQWKNLQANTQLLKSTVSIPSIARTSLGIDGQFQLYKKDSTFLELKSSLGIQYLLTNGNTLKVFYRNYQSSILSGGQSNSTSLQLADVNTNYYGLSIQKQTLDYLPSPTKGYSLQLEGSIGLRTKRDSTLHTSITTTTAKLEYQFTYYFAIKKRHILKINTTSECLIAPSFSRNELLRFGGMTSQRGFKEEELRATSRILASMEYRFLLDPNSYLFLFYDQSWYENKLATTQRDTPYGFGGGLTFGTQLGLFSISYGLGKQLQNPILIRNGNIHFGYVSYF